MGIPDGKTEEFSDAKGGCSLHAMGGTLVALAALGGVLALAVYGASEFLARI